MFSLIISIISIALVAALAAATVYFGGAAFNKGSAGADASTFVNAGQQIAGAFTLASADGYTVDTVADLNAGDLVKTKGEIYLAQIPSYKGTSLDGIMTNATTSGKFVVSAVSDLVCAEIVKRSGGSSATIKTFATATDFKPTDLYGCVKSTEALTPVGGVATKANDHVAFYKVK